MQSDEGRKPHMGPVEPSKYFRAHLDWINEATNKPKVATMGGETWSKLEKMGETPKIELKQSMLWSLTHM